MYRSTVRLTGSLMLFGALVTATGCDYKSPSAPGGSSAAPGPEGATISITPSGLTPGAVTVAAGQSVTFVNNDSVAHNIASGPVPTYDGCPAINRVGTLAPGQSMQTSAFPTGGTCTFIDLLRTGDSRWQGTIAVQ